MSATKGFKMFNLHRRKRRAHHIVGECCVVGVHGGAGHGAHAGLHRVAET